MHKAQEHVIAATQPLIFSIIHVGLRLHVLGDNNLVTCMQHVPANCMVGYALVFPCRKSNEPARRPQDSVACLEVQALTDGLGRHLYLLLCTLNYSKKAQNVEGLEIHA